MTEPMTALPFGSWPSPITARSLVQGAAGVGEVITDGDTICWTESRPEERGRVAVMRWRDGETIELSPPDTNVRTSVHEYGGGAWWVSDGSLWFVDFADQRLRVLRPGATEPELLTPEPDIERGLRYADGRPTPDGQWFVCVRERHAVEHDTNPANELVAVATDGSMSVETLWSSADFVGAPRLSPDGSTLAWIQWQNPDMPWDTTELVVAAFETVDGQLQLGDTRVVAGGSGESVVQPEWGADGSLYAISDRTDWWNLYRFSADDPAAAAEPIDVGEFEVGTPAWVFNMQRYAITAAGVVTARTAAGRDVLAGPWQDDRWSAITSVRSFGDGVVFVGASHSGEPEVVQIDDGAVRVIRSARDLGLDDTYFPEPEHITFPVVVAGGPDEEAHALFYAPANPDAAGTDGARPPLLVKVHGGPTAAARSQLQLGHRYWTSRGIAVVDVNYRGSIGYGREFRNALRDRWGIADVEDCVAAARFLAERGDVDGDRLAIAGGSAGGYTVLAALTFHDAFSVGASRYGVADLTSLAADTHKFEARYLDGLVGPWPDAEAIYNERSPINFTDQLACPMILLQGGEDRVVPPNQAELMVAALNERSLPYSYVLFPSEGHGFREADNIVAALESELSFFAQIFGFTPADDIAPVEIVNL